MARMLQGILGGLSGKIGNVVGSSWKGIPVLKTLPLSVANPKTAKQQAQRGAMASSVAFSKAILVAVIKPLWDRFAQQQSGYNAWISSNIDKFDTAGLNDAEGMTISEGSLTPAAINTAVATGGTATVDVNWTDNSGTGSAVATDSAYAVAFNATTGVIGQIAAVSSREDESTTIIMPADMVAGDEIVVWLAFRRADGTLVSNTSFDATAAV